MGLFPGYNVARQSARFEARDRHRPRASPFLCIDQFANWRIAISSPPRRFFVIMIYISINIMMNELIDKLAWIYIKDRKILSTRSRGKDVWYIPGGKREGGEADEQALLREIKEELTVDLVPETIKHLGTFKAQAHGKPEGVFVQMTCYTAEHKGELTPSAEIEEISWLTSDTDPALLSPVDRIIFAYLKDKNIIN